MATIKSVYLGDLKTKATHLLSGTEILTDPPLDNQGTGSTFSPTDLVAAALGSCMMTIMGIVARRDNIDLKGMGMEITKIMSTDPPRRITEIHVMFDFAEITLDDSQKIKLKNAALTCPVAYSLDPAIKQVVDFGF